MKKARFSSQQQAVKIIEDTDKYYIFICLNEEKKTEKLKDTDKDTDKELEYFEYDYAEIVELKENIDIKDVESNPSKYLHYTNPEKLADIKATKLKAVSQKCEETIYAGVDVRMSDGTYHFSLTEKDQLNIFGLQAKISAGQTALEYHADGQPCKYYSVEDIQKLITAAMALVSYNTTYCNSLNMWIKAETDSRVIEGIYYGIDIPEIYQSDVLEKYISSKSK